MPVVERGDRSGGVDPAVLSLDDFERMVAEELDGFPGWVRDAVADTAFLSEDRPGPGVARPGTLLLGLFRGIPLTRRGSRIPGSLPNTITLYRLPILRVCTAPADVRPRIRRILGHEIGHALGLDETRLRDLGWH